MKLASFPLELATPPLVRKAYTRDAYAPLLCRGINRACAGHTPLPQTEPHLQKPFQAIASEMRPYLPAELRCRQSFFNEPFLGFRVLKFQRVIAGDRRHFFPGFLQNGDHFRGLGLRDEIRELIL